MRGVICLVRMVQLLSCSLVLKLEQESEQGAGYREGVKNVALSVTSVCVVHMQPGEPCPQREYYQGCEQDVILQSVTD